MEPANAEIGAPKDPFAPVKTTHASGARTEEQEGISSNAERTRRRVNVSPSGRRRMLSVESRPETSWEEKNTNRPAGAETSSRVVSPLPSSLSKRIEISHVFPNVKCHLAGAATAAWRGEEKQRGGSGSQRESAAQTRPSMKAFTSHTSSLSFSASAARTSSARSCGIAFLYGRSDAVSAS